MVLNRYIWKTRILLIFAPSPATKEYREMKTLLNESQPLLDEREIVLVQVFKIGNSYLGDTLLNRETAQQLREQFSVEDNGFSMLLLGKNGIEVFRDNKPADIKKILSSLDIFIQYQSQGRQQ